MPGRKKSSAREWTAALGEMRRYHGVVLEEMRSQNRATIEVVEARFESLTQRFDDAQEETNERFAVVEGSIRSLVAQIREVDESSQARDEHAAVTLRELKVNVLENGVDLRALAGKVDALSRLEDRVTALEKRAR